ncbi:hypothetical protein [Clostridium sp. 1xD42-85]|uniref:hypothetical protein n=1 Tax=Clostridium sp. 1xD42-85 TaxID=2320084 RepID=UPI000EA2C123|nr:hypothetical protein [Clostridium sp. 1xD42-85]NBJ68937.1 hypothetical protein [Roseburia sp. 1XD42-34]RKI79842.1 hypothetical protein D7V87_05540 [Clostridium sp. 1xD42-85]
MNESVVKGIPVEIVGLGFGKICRNPNQDFGVYNRKECMLKIKQIINRKIKTFVIWLECVD